MGRPGYRQRFDYFIWAALPHSFRHSFATLTYEHTEDIFAVQLQLGHKDQKTTQRYIAQLQGEKAK